MLNGCYEVDIKQYVDRVMQTTFVHVMEMVLVVKVSDDKEEKEKMAKGK